MKKAVIGEERGAELVWFMGRDTSQRVQKRMRGTGAVTNYLTAEKKRERGVGKEIKRGEEVGTSGGVEVKASQSPHLTWYDHTKTRKEKKKKKRTPKKGWLRARLPWSYLYTPTVIRHYRKERDREALRGRGDNLGILNKGGKKGGEGGEWRGW